MQAWEERYYDKQEAQEEGRAEGRAEGLAEGRSAAIAEVIQALVETYMEYNVSREDAKQKIMCKLKLDEETASQYLEKYWK